jgi:hypothetical protein
MPPRKAPSKTTTPKRTASLARHGIFDVHMNGTALIIEREVYTYRFLFSDGDTLDVIDYQDGSDTREAVLAFTGKERIEGVARVTP